jgi:hypothetical protein
MSTNRYQGVVDPLLSTAAIAYTNDAYIAGELLPTIPVNFQSGKHWIYNQGRFRNQTAKRAAGAKSGEVELTITTGNPYFCEDHALKQFVLDEDVENATTPTDPYTDATENVSEMLLIGREVEAAAMLTSTATITQNTTLSGTSQLSDYSNSDPFTVVETGKQTIHSATHLMPNVLVMGKQAWDKLKYHPALLERVKYSQRAQLTTDLVASLFEVDRILIGAAGKNTSAEGQTDSMSYIWGKDMLLAYVAPRIAPKMLTLGLNYQWAKKTKNVKRLRGTDEEDRNGTYIRVGDDYYDMNITSAGCGYLIKNAVA